MISCRSPGTEPAAPPRSARARRSPPASWETTVAGRGRLLGGPDAGDDDCRVMSGALSSMGMALHLVPGDYGVGESDHPKGHHAFTRTGGPFRKAISVGPRRAARAHASHPGLRSSRGGVAEDGLSHSPRCTGSEAVGVQRRTGPGLRRMREVVWPGDIRTWSPLRTVHGVCLESSLHVHVGAASGGT
ncbi:hypothetical protein VUR80DRAFT_9310 [Thermomyces stellatus]